ncbi:MAG: dihydroneopterin aldolase [Nitrosomonas sp.]|uniref:dihydroneopterin aldolase n=1 Tax=Nitrosomonas sp. TaxID=42353 RepID=UPI0025D096A0|nr:dihydroneopterin aldolase [Nitrosomonas sp.]MBY0474338.1 dihydroneopterin aldolase [Nitrosomonas sp.]
MDIIFLHDFKAKTLIGIYPWERIVPQTIQIDLEIALPTSRACQSDNIQDALDYALIIERINEILTKHHFSLLEALAEYIAQTILTEFQSPWVKISVAKLGIIRGVKKLGVCIERTPDAVSDIRSRIGLVKN